MVCIGGVFIRDILLSLGKWLTSDKKIGIKFSMPKIMAGRKANAFLI